MSGWGAVTRVHRGWSITASVLASALVVASATAMTASATTEAPACPSDWERDAAVLRVPNEDLDLHDVTVADRYDAWAVGTRTRTGVDGTPPQPLFERWDGRTWREVSVPGPSTGLDRVLGVVATSSTDVWAVGDIDTGGASRPAARHFDGTEWHLVDLGEVAARPGILGAVDASGPDNVWAVGSEWVDGAGPSYALAAMWDGAGWHRTVLEDQPGTGFSDVAVLAPDDVWAVGHQYNGGYNVQLIAHWDGTRWSRVPLRTRIGSLAGVSAVAPDDVWAVGTTSNRPTLVHWDGATWTDVPDPVAGPAVDGWLHDVFGSLEDVDAASSDDVWAVGSYQDDASSDALDLMVHWDGTTWTQAPSPTRGIFFHHLRGIAASAAGEWWAVGDDDFEAMTLRRCDATAVPTNLTARPVVASTASGTPRLTATVSATLRTTQGAGVQGVQLTFDLGNGAQCTGWTDADGTASCWVIARAAAVRNQGYTVVFAGDQFFLPSTATAGLVD